MSETCGHTTQDGGECGNPASEPDGSCYIPSHGGNAGNRQAHPHPNERYSAETVAKALRKNDGVVSDAADALGDISVKAVYGYIDRYEVCEEAHSTDFLVDKSKSTLSKKMDSDDERVALDAAKHVSRHYDDDAKTQQDITSNDQTVGQPPEGLADLTEEQLRALAGDPDNADTG